MAETSGAKLRRILRERDKVSRKKTEVEVRKSVVRLVFENQDLQGVLAELGTCAKNTCSLGRVNKEYDDKDGILPSNDGGITVPSLLMSFKFQSELSGLPVSLIAAKKCSGLLLELLNDGAAQGDPEDNSPIFSPSNQQEKLEVLLKTLAQLARDPAHFDHAHFIECIRNKVLFPLELIWILNKHSIVTFDRFIKSNLGSPGVYKKLTNDILSLAKGEFPPERGELAQCMLSDLVTAMVASAFPKEDHSLPSHDKSLQEIYQMLLETIFNGAFDHCLANGEERTLFLKASWLGVTSLNQFISCQLLNLLCYKPTWTVTQAITKQVTWTSANTGGLLSELFKELSFGLETKQRMDILRRTLEEEEVNWKTTLMFSSFMLIDSGDAKTHYKELLTYFLHEAFESMEQEGLISAFLLARQAACEGTHVFMSYKDWFQSTFCEGSHPLLSSKKEVAFLLSFLTNLVPLEPAQFLKIHVQCSSFVPAKYNVMLDDYITLAKTRLTDLKVPWDSTGIFKTKRVETESDGTTNQSKNPVEGDVVRAVEAYEQTGKIPSTVIQAIMFKRKYYHCYFLPTLLAPRMIPDIPDSKMKLILALNEANKIPCEQYREYEQKCGEMLNDLLEGAFSEDVVMDEVLEPMDALKATCKKLGEIIESEGDEADVRRQLSAVSESLKSLIPEAEYSEGAVIDLDGDELDKTLVEAVDVILACFCSATRVPVIGSGQNSPPCQELLAAMLACHPSLHPTLFKRIWTVLVTKTTDESETSHLDLSVICAVLHAHQIQGRFPKVKTYKLACHTTILTAIMEAPQHSTAEQFTSNLRFFFGALQSLVTCDGDSIAEKLIPQQLIHKFCYLTGRLRCASDHTIDQSITGSTFKAIMRFRTTERFIDLKKSTEELPFLQWCLWELQVVPHMDILSDVERCNYQHYTVFSEFLPRLQQLSDTTDIYWTACKTIITAIVDTDNSSLPLSPEERGYNCRREMIQLVAELLWMMPPGQTVSPDVLYLMSMVSERLKTLEDADPLLVQALAAGDIKSLFSIFVCLPPVFLLVNHPAQPINDSLITHLAHTLETVREYVMDEPTTLPLLLTIHIFQGIVSLASHCGSTDEVLNKLMNKSPILKTSIMYHWSKLQSLVLSGMPHSAVYAQFNAAHKWSAALSSHGTAMSLQDSSALDHDLVATAIYRSICQDPQSALQVWEDYYSHLEEQVCVPLAVLLISHTAWALLHHFQGSSHLIQILLHLFQRHGHSFMRDVLTGTPAMRAKCFHPYSAALSPAVFFSCLDDTRCAIWKSPPTGSLLTVALACHNKIRNMYLQGSSQDLPHDSTEFLSVEQLAVHNNIIRRLVELSPPDIVRGIPLELIRACSPMVQSLLRVHPS